VDMTGAQGKGFQVSSFDDGTGTSLRYLGAITTHIKACLATIDPCIGKIHDMRRLVSECEALWSGGTARGAVDGQKWRPTKGGGYPFAFCDYHCDEVHEKCVDLDLHTLNTYVMCD
jgi:hypothetical protein